MEEPEPNLNRPERGERGGSLAVAVRGFSFYMKKSYAFKPHQVVLVGFWAVLVLHLLMDALTHSNMILT
jgi:hypothetical protein